MPVRKSAFASALLLIASTSLTYAAEKNYSGQNKEVQILSELSAEAPGEPGHVIKQITETWKYVSPDPEFNGALGLAIEQQDIVNGQINQHGYGMSRSTNGDETYFTFQSIGKLDGQKVSGSGTWTWTGGTGSFKGVKGGGTYNYNAGPGVPFSYEWSGKAM